MIESLSRERCLELLAQEEVGRLAVNDWNTPVIFPVNYRLEGELIVFRTDPGTKQTRGPWAAASFEIDHVDPTTRSGWSVVVTGRLEEITALERDALARARQLGVDPWGGGAKAHWMRLTPTRITGRVVTGD